MATNHTVSQVMRLVSGLTKLLKDVSGMKMVVEEIADCISPLFDRQPPHCKTKTI